MLFLSLITWIDCYCQEGLKGLVTPIKSQRIQRLGTREKEEMKKMVLEQKPTDYGIDRQIWTGKIIIEVIYSRWGAELKDSRIYEMLKEMGLSHQKAHREHLPSLGVLILELLEVIDDRIHYLAGDDLLGVRGVCVAIDRCDGSRLGH